MSRPDDSPLLAGLLQPGAYDHPAGPIRLFATHISWVLLTGFYAYKIKKPVDFGFLDFSTLERRRYYCHEEVRLNRRLAPELYLDVLPITGPPRQPRMGGSGPPIEYAVKMRQFDPTDVLSQVAQRHALQERHIDRLADILADFHARAARAGADDGFGTPERIAQAQDENFPASEILTGTDEDPARLRRLQDWTRSAHPRMRAFVKERKAGGFIRECHGDLHLGNIVLLDDRPVPFDCIEFNPHLRWIDLVSELAFLAMDLEVTGLRPLAYRLVNRYAHRLGDYAGFALWTYYRMYRAMVRAKIARLTLTQTTRPEERRRLLEQHRRYVDFATELIEPSPPGLVITHGLSGSGKSFIAERLSEQLPALWLRSDLERKRLAGFRANAGTGSPVGGGIYGVDATRATYQRLLELTRAPLMAGLSVILDATFLKRWQRDSLRQLAREVGVRFYIADIRTPDELLRQRILQRAAAATDPSEASLEVVDSQKASEEPLSPDEQPAVIPVDGSAPDFRALLLAIRLP